MVISAPTGSGKTVLFELCILRLLSNFIVEGKFIHVKGTLKSIYIAPSKALVQEKVRDWNQKFGSWGVSCLELTGDNETYNVKYIQEADIILTTPEKFDAVTRYRIKDGGLGFFSDIALVLIDEVHLLNDPRGAVLEAIVSRIKMIARNPEMKSSPLSHVRFLAVSATIPNIGDLAEWLNVPVQGVKRFGEEMRPVKLTSKVFGYAPAKNDFMFEKRLQNYIFDVLMQYSRGKSALVFCSTRKGAQEAAQRLSQAAMTYGNKEKGLYMEYDRSTILQMCGRAGRPPFDDTGIVIIMTRRDTVHLYENLLNGCEIVESQLLSCVTEHLTAEIVQMTIPDIIKAIEWMKCSYLFVRMKKNPQKYAIKNGIPNHNMEKHMEDICIEKVNELSRHQMIWMDEDGFLLKPLDPGRLMTKYYLKFDTMKHIMHAPENCSLEEALRIICHAEEISWIQLRRNEKKLLNDVNNDKDGRLRFHILGEKGKKKKRIQTREEKIFILANDCLTGDPLIHDLSLSQDMNSICSNGCRIAKCMKEYFVYRKNYKGTYNSMLLAKSLYQKLWDDSPFLLKQLPGIGMVTAKALHSMGIKSFEALAEADPRKIEIVTGRKYPFGNHIKESLSSLPPKVDLKLEEAECPKQGKAKLIVTLTRMPQTEENSISQIVGSEEDNQILFHEKIRVDEFSSPYSTVVLLSHPQQGKLTIKADLIFDEYIGIDLHRKLQLMEQNLNVRNKWGRMPPSSHPPEEVYVIDDDGEPLPQAATNELPISGDLNPLLDSMPSFNLLDEDLEEADPATGNDEDECKIITERTVFDHIREKAKNFPMLAASKNNAHSPAAVTYSLTKNKQPLELQVEALEEKHRIELSPHAKLDSFSGFRDEVQNNEYVTQQSHITSGPRFIDDDKVESMGMVCFDISMMKENKRARAGPESSSDMNSSKWKKQQQSQSVGNRKNWCSLQTATETSEVDPFVAFKSVFSFL
ncbi:ATP-dependent DNA helicase MER3-like protein [Cucumis melo var. makuwa]|uniref:DNA 3'-5' helicase n=1 Tax=Cucumis melo var. makuwa TaxID=1194695 RepID=A0A5D3BVU3_CUCMM|nr:ATP-dependent DNA helicase MER3-like protein [Cucumis melo var. makuwa]